MNLSVDHDPPYEGWQLVDLPQPVSVEPLAVLPRGRGLDSAGRAALLIATSQSYSALEMVTFPVRCPPGASASTGSPPSSPVRAWSSSLAGAFCRDGPEVPPRHCLPTSHGHAAGTNHRYQRAVTGVAIAPDGNWLATGSADGTCGSGHLASSRSCAAMRMDGAISGCAWLGSERIAVAGTAGPHIFDFAR